MLDYCMITERVATGSCPVSTEDIDELLSVGINCIVNTAHDAPVIDDSRVHYLLNPTYDDGLNKPVEFWKTTLDFALPLLEDSRNKIYAHCLHGINRGPSTAACILIAQGWSVDDVRQKIVEVRPQAQLRYINDANQACMSFKV